MVKMPWDRDKKEDKEDTQKTSAGDLDLEDDKKDPPTKKETVTDPPPTPTGAESPFGHPSLKGMSEEDIANRLALLNSTVKEQGAALSEATRARAVSPTVEGTPEPKATPTAAEFWEDPAKEIKSMIQEQMEETIKPFREDLQAGRSQTAWERVAARHSNFAERKPMIDTLLSRMGIAEPDEGTLEMLFHTAVGLGVQAGETMTRTEDPPKTEDPTRRDPPPQHAPSSHPVGRTEKAKEYRELTESEKEVRRMQGFKTDEEYLDWLELDDADLLTEAKTK